MCMYVYIISIPFEDTENSGFSWLKLRAVSKAASKRGRVRTRTAGGSTQYRWVHASSDTGRPHFTSS